MQKEKKNKKRLENITLRCNQPNDVILFICNTRIKMTDINFLYYLMIIIIAVQFELTNSSSVTSDLKNVSTILNNLLKSYDRYHRPTYGGLYLI